MLFAGASTCVRVNRKGADTLGAELAGQLTFVAVKINAQYSTSLSFQQLHSHQANQT